MGGGGAQATLKVLLEALRPNTGFFGLSIRRALAGGWQVEHCVCARMLCDDMCLCAYRDFGQCELPTVCCLITISVILCGCVCLV